MAAEDDGVDGKSADGAQPAASTASSPTDAPARTAEAKTGEARTAEAKAEPPAKAVDKKPAKAGDKKPEKAMAKPADKPRYDRTRPPPAPPWYRTLRSDPPPHLRIALALAFTGLLLLVWWFLTRGGNTMVYEFDLDKSDPNPAKWHTILAVKFYPSLDRIIPAIKFPSPGEVFGAFPALVDPEQQDFTKHLMRTLQRVFIGMGLAAIVGVSVGIISASLRGVNAAIAPLVVFLRSVPMGSLVPLTIALWGIEEEQKTRFLFLAVVGFVFADTVKAISVVPERYVETAQTLGASRFQIVRKVLVPLALPDIITSLRFQLGLCLGYITLAEAINPKFGVGALLNVSESRGGGIATIYLLLIMLAAIALLIDLLLRTIQRGVFRWRRDL